MNKHTPRTRTPGKAKPAGAKLARMAAGNRIGVMHPHPVTAAPKKQKRK